MGNMLLYPVPKPTYKISGDDPTLLFVSQEIEKSFCGSFLCPENRRESTQIPCRYIPCQTYASPYLIVFFHGNSEDIGKHLGEILLQFGERFSMDVLCPEYPGYGIYSKKDDSLTMDEAMLQDARTVLRYCHEQLRYKYENIILVGRSLGTGVVTRLACDFSVRGAVLISAFTAIRDVAKRMVGNMLSKFVPDVFRNIDYVSFARCPLLFIHGEDDAMIPPEMSVMLYAKTSQPKALRINQFMTHNQFRIESDVFAPMYAFLVGNLRLKGYLMPKIKKGSKAEASLLESQVLHLRKYADNKNSDTEESSTPEGEIL